MILFRLISGFLLSIFIPNNSFSALWGIPFREPTKVQFTYDVEIDISKKDVGKKLSIWIPYPIADTSQKILKFRATSPWKYRITRESKFGNRMIYVYGKAKSTKLTFNYDILRLPYKGKKGKRTALFLKPDQLVPQNDMIKNIAIESVGNLKTSSEKIRALYDTVVKNMQYDKSGAGWGRGDAVWACNAKRGNCTDFHSLFIGMSRSLKIPARFEIGFPIPHDQKTEEISAGEIPGYHCWAEAYSKDLGRWIPLDATEAKKTGLVNDYFGVLPTDRIHFSEGRDIILNPPQKGEPLNYFIYPYVELDGKTLSSGIKKRFSFLKMIVD